MTLQVGQTTQPRIPPSNYFPTIFVCLDPPFDGSKLSQSGLPETFFQINDNSSVQEFPDLNQTWNNVTMGIGHSLEVFTLARNWDKGTNRQKNYSIKKLQISIQMLRLLRLILYSMESASRFG